MNDDERFVAVRAAREFFDQCSLKVTPDAIEQMVDVFLPCLKIMCERPWAPDGSTWRRSGVLGALSDVRKKFERLWERGWKRGVRHDDSGYDLINFVGFYMRSEENPRWGDWGEPGEPKLPSYPPGDQGGDIRIGIGEYVPGQGLPARETHFIGSGEGPGSLTLHLQSPRPRFEPPDDPYADWRPPVQQEMPHRRPRHRSSDNDPTSPIPNKDRYTGWHRPPSGDDPGQAFPPSS